MEVYLLMDKTILITRPNHDSTTNYLYYWSKPVIEVATKKGFKILDLQGKKANRKTFESYLNTNKPSLIFLNGHGSEEKIAGYNNEILVDNLTVKTNLLEGKIMYSRSCRSAVALGKNVIVHGKAKAFIGYSRDFIFLIDNNYSTKPYLDPVAKPFMESSNLVATTLIKGHSVKEAHLRSKSEMKKALLKSLLSDATEAESRSAPYLLSNFSSQTIYGDESATI